MTLHPQENQLTAFPPTVDELLAAYRSRLEADREKAAGSRIKATAREDEATAALAAFDAAIAAIGSTDKTPAAPTDCTGADTCADGGCESGYDKGCGAYLPTFVVPPTHIPAVHVIYGPEPLDQVRVPVGDRTRFAALVFAAAEQLDVKDPDLPDWTITTDGGGIVDPKDTVMVQDYGRTFTVERRDDATR